MRLIYVNYKIGSILENILGHSLEYCFPIYGTVMMRFWKNSHFNIQSYDNDPKLGLISLSNIWDCNNVPCLGKLCSPNKWD